MGHVLDLVPNHMGIASSANPWWQDVLENGPSSRFARFFDIEWHPVKDELADKVLIPILGDQYGAVLERQELQVVYRGRRVRRAATATTRLPLAPDTYPAILGISMSAGAAGGRRERRGRRAAEHHHRRREPAAAHDAGRRGDRDARARERSRQAPARHARRVAARRCAR